MSTRRLVDPQLLPVLDQFPGITLTPESLEATRAFLAQLAAQRPPAKITQDVVSEELRIPGPPGAPDVRVLLYTPTETKGLRPAYLHVHGGGYVMGSADMSADANKGLASELACVVASVDYQLAPETRFPGAVEDCYAALKWLKSEAADLRIDPQRIAIGGESAGGGLAAALAILARDRREVPIIFQLLIYPMIDDRSSRAALSPSVGEFVWTRESNTFGWSSLLGEAAGGPDVSPYAAAARVADVRGLPPAFIGVGSLDLFLEEDVNYAARLLQAGITTELHVYPGAFHGFEMAVDADVTKSAVQNARSALRRAFAGA